MKLFKCQACGQAIYFENRFCGVCGHALGYLPITGQMAAVEPDGDNWVALTAQRPPLRYCANVTPDACNWMIAADSTDDFCLACRHNRTIPDLNTGENLSRWRSMEIAKHRLFYTLIELRLPLKNLNDDPVHGLIFDFLAEDSAAKVKILTGHDEGLITINLNEADDALREKLRTAMGEPYRTLLGHFRHEVGHHFWDLLIRDDLRRLEAFRAMFGDETADYAEALKRHYAEGAPEDWQARFISSYATAHPWEDFAETWAHYLHIVDTLETATAFGLQIHPANTRNPALHADIDFDPHRAESMQMLIDAWLPLTFAVNSLNRSMGHKDLYPFVVSKPVVEKLQFIHDLIHDSAVQPRNAPPEHAGQTRGDAPGQPPAPPPIREDTPGQDIPPPAPPVIDPPIDPPDERPPVELPPDEPAEMPPPAPNEAPTPVPLNR